jgi:hypothetical protein
VLSIVPQFVNFLQLADVGIRNVQPVQLGHARLEFSYGIVARI